MQKWIVGASVKQNADQLFQTGQDQREQDFACNVICKWRSIKKKIEDIFVLYNLKFILCSICLQIITKKQDKS